MKRHISGLFVFLFFIAGCASMEFNSMEKTKKLEKNMKYEQVVQMLGEPQSSRTQSGKLYAKYRLHEYWKGWVPFYAVFDNNSKRLISWYVDEKEYEKEQKAGMAAIQQNETTSKTASSGSNVLKPKTALSGPNNPDLMKAMAATYYSYTSAGSSYSGGTERKVMLCPDGRYSYSSESGYSGGAGTSGAWGTASQGGASGTWRVQGNINEGTLTTIDSSGSATDYHYRRCGSDCVYFGNIKFVIAGPANCK